MQNIDLMLVDDLKVTSMRKNLEKLAMPLQKNKASLDTFLNNVIMITDNSSIV